MSSYQRRNSDWQAYGQTYGQGGSLRRRRLLQRLARQRQQQKGGRK